MSVAGVVLDDEHRAHPALLAAHHGIEAREVYLTALDPIHK